MSASQKGTPLILWTKQEDILLAKTYVETPKAILTEKFKRSWRSIRYRAQVLGIKRSKSVIIQDNIEGTKKAMLEKYGVEYSTLLPYPSTLIV